MGTDTGSKAHSYLTLDGNDENALVGWVSTQLAHAKETPYIPIWHLIALMKVPWSVGSRHREHWQRKHSTFLPGT